jgi:hypothetical protein
LEAIKNTQLSWGHIKVFASTRHLSQRDIGDTLKELLREALKGSDELLKSNVELFERYLEYYRNDEPFEDLPGEIRVYLERIRDQLPNGIETLDPLVNYLRDLSAENLREKKRQKLIAILSLMIGAAGLFIGILSIFNWRLSR